MVKPKMILSELFGLIPNDYLSLIYGYKIYLVGVRGYYRDTMGKPGVNDRGLYDDAMFIVGPNGIYEPYNANTDPSRYQTSIASLMPGVYMYARGMHGVSGPHPYMALRQHGNVTVMRDGGKVETDSADHRFWIDIHRGGVHTTSSLGCQTIIPDEWNEFYGTYDNEKSEWIHKGRVPTLMDKYNQSLIPYILIEYPSK